MDLKANITEDEIMSLWFQGAEEGREGEGGEHAWTNKDGEENGAFVELRDTSRSAQTERRCRR